MIVAMVHADALGSLVRPRPGFLSCLLCLVMLAGCGDDDRPPPPCLVGCDAGPSCDNAYTPPPSNGDADGDGTPDDRDDDADGDGVSNVFENLGGFNCRGPDEDGDGVDNWLDRDSDNDGLLDGTEADGDSDPYTRDTDGDGSSDLIERAAGTSPTDDNSRPADGSTAVIVPHMGGDVLATVAIDNRIENADVFFLVDTTGSMADERANLIAGMETVIVPELANQFADVAYGVGGLDDYPVDSYGEAGDQPFYLVTTMIDGLEDERSAAGTGTDCPTTVEELMSGSNGVIDVVEALRTLACHNGSDLPESFVPALWATATGMGLTWSSGSLPDQVCATGHTGYPCFRPDAFPIILLVGDAAFHNGPRPAFDYGFPAPGWEETIDALNARGAKVVSVFSGEEPADRGDYEDLARRTGTLQPDGTPMVFDIDPDGTGLDTTVVDAMRVLAGGVVQDVSATAGNVEGSTSDATSFVQRLTTREAFEPSGSPGGYDRKDDTTFFETQGGTRCEFEITLRNDTTEATEEAQVFVLLVRGVGSGGSTFATRRVFIAVGPDNLVL